MTTNEPRPIEDLIKLTTYQGMSDAEIASVVNYYVNVAVSEAVFNATNEGRKEIENEVIVSHNEVNAKALECLNNLATAALQLEVVSLDE